MTVLLWTTSFTRSSIATQVLLLIGNFKPLYLCYIYSYLIDSPCLSNHKNHNFLDFLNAENYDLIVSVLISPMRHYLPYLIFVENVSPVGTTMDWKNYHRLKVIHDFMDDLEYTYPSLCSVGVVGYSIEGRALKVSN